MRQQLASDWYSAVIGADDSVVSVELTWYEEPPPAQERGTTSTAGRAIVTEALALKNSLGLPFWDAVLVSAARAGELPSDLTNALLFHQNIEGRAFSVTREEIRGGRLRELVRAADSSRSLALLSRVRTSKGELHFPMIDFACAVSSASESVARTIARAVMPGVAVLVCSGASYHAFSATLVDSASRIKMLAQALQFGPIVDRAYVSHQLQQGFSALRISESSKRCAPTILAAPS